MEYALLIFCLSGSVFYWIKTGNAGFQWMGKNCGAASNPDIPGRSAAAGQVCVWAVAHQSQQVVGQSFYCGSKESERPAVAQLIEDQDLAHQKLSLDALHLISSTLTLIHTAHRRGAIWGGIKA